MSSVALSPPRRVCERQEEVEVRPSSACPNTRLIPVSPDSYAIVDEQDYAALAKYKWRLSPSKRLNYVVRCTRENGRAVRRRMHRVIMGAAPGQFVDHINGDPLDNRRCNLRFATCGENNLNQKPQSKTGFKGVSRTRGGNAYSAEICRHGKHYYLGTFDTPEKAAIAYDRAAKELHGEFAWLNFPDEAEAA